MKLVVFFLGNVPAVDLAGHELLEELHGELKARGTKLRLAEAHGEVRETLVRAGFEKHGVPILPNQPIATVIAEWKAAGGA